MGRIRRLISDVLAETIFVMLYKNVPSRWLFVLLVSILGLLAEGQAEDFPEAVNELGLEVMAQLEPGEDGNVLFSPYSLQSVLVMAYVGADGVTREEMARVLYFPNKVEQLEDQYMRLNQQLLEMQEPVPDYSEEGAVRRPIIFECANQFFVQEGFPFLPKYRDALKGTFDVDPMQLDFVNQASESADVINGWVDEKTHGKISDILNASQFDEDSIGVLVNAVYLNALWKSCFEESDTRDEKFWVNGTERRRVPTMVQAGNIDYRKSKWGTVLSLPYEGGELQFLICLPKGRKMGMRGMLDELTPEKLEQFAFPEARREIELHLPRFRIEQADAMDLKPVLQELGMTTAFNIPEGSADFSGMGTPPPDKLIAIDSVAQKTYLEVNEEGSEAAAVTVVEYVLSPFSVDEEPEPPLVVKVDRPFFFAIQHKSSGACLFMGWLAAPGMTESD